MMFLKIFIATHSIIIIISNVFHKNIYQELIWPCVKHYFFFALLLFFTLKKKSENTHNKTHKVSTDCVDSLTLPRPSLGLITATAPCFHQPSNFMIRVVSNFLMSLPAPDSIVALSS